MENNSQELETKTSNKDMWLFLIVLDVIFLCVFGFFLYKYFAAHMINPAPAVVQETEAVDALPEISEEVIMVTQTNVIKPPVAVKEETIVAAPKAKPQAVADKKSQQVAEKKSQQVAETKPQSVPVVASKTPAKESIVVAPVVANSKYRRVTFKWFGDGKQVSIVSGFTMSKPQALKKVGDHWEITLSIAPGTYKFLYIIDGKNTRDPYAAEKDGRSLVVIK
ncbi:MAG: hypothetical protein J6Y17_00735 [Elusimicrobiaceae bacterium]|nr:hypothetical protein [Elusimicrobiaceae bacterium]